MSMTGNRGFGELAEILGDAVVDTALLDRVLHRAVLIPIEGNSYRLRKHGALVPEHMRGACCRARQHQFKRRPGRPRKEDVASMMG